MDSLVDMVPEQWQGIVAAVVVVASAITGVLGAVRGARESKPAPVAPSPAAALDALPASLGMARQVSALIEFIVVHDAGVLRAVVLEVELPSDDDAEGCLTTVLAVKGSPQAEWFDAPTAPEFRRSVVRPLLNSQKWVWRTADSIGDNRLAAVYSDTPGMAGAMLYYIAHSANAEGCPESVMLLSLHTMTEESVAPLIRELAVAELRKLANPQGAP